MYSTQLQKQLNGIVKLLDDEFIAPEEDPFRKVPDRQPPQMSPSQLD